MFSKPVVSTLLLLPLKTRLIASIKLDFPDSLSPTRIFILSSKSTANELKRLKFFNFSLVINFIVYVLVCRLLALPTTHKYTQLPYPIQTLTNELCFAREPFIRVLSFITVYPLLEHQKPIKSTILRQLMFSKRVVSQTN